MNSCLNPIRPDIVEGVIVDAVVDEYHPGGQVEALSEPEKEQIYFPELTELCRSGDLYLSCPRSVALRVLLTKV